MFTLDPRLEKETIYLGEFPLSRVLLMNDARYPWVILVPRIVGLTECFQLDDAQQAQLSNESNFVAESLKERVQADKMNVAALGNVVSQLHIHHVARYHADETWPAPVWGKGEVIPYTEQEREMICEQLIVIFSELFSNG